jgi:hypothetical protein
LQQVHSIADEISNQSKDLASAREVSLEPFSPYFSKLLDQYSREFDKYRLDEIVVAAIAPVVRLFLWYHRGGILKHILSGTTLGRGVESTRRTYRISLVVSSLAAGI